MSEDMGFHDMKMLLNSFERMEEEETIESLRKITEHLRKDIQMKEYFFELSGVTIVLNVSVGANITVLNTVLDALAAAVEDHEGNKIKLTLERTFSLINNILISTESIGHTASLRALVLLSYVCAENIHAQELASTSQCVNTMGKLFVKLSQDLLGLGDVKDEKKVFTWNILCTAIAAVCGEPANQKNQDNLRSVVHEGANFLNEWSDKTRINMQEISCLKTLLIMLPYVLCNNRTNQEYFARSGGIHTVISGLVSFEKQKNVDYNISEINGKLVYLLSVSLTENLQICKLAGILGAIPMLVHLLKQFHNKDKGIVLICLSNLLRCQENEKIFSQLDVFTGLASQLDVFPEGSECWNIIDRICNHIRRKLKSHCDQDLSDLTSSKKNNMHSDSKHYSEDMLSHIDPTSSNRSLLSSKPLFDDEIIIKDCKMNTEYNFSNEKYVNNKAEGILLHKKSYQSLSDDYFGKSKYRYDDEDPQRLPSCYRRAQDMTKDEDSVVDYKYRMGHYNRKNNQYEQNKSMHFHRFDDQDTNIQSAYHKRDRAQFNSSLKECGRKERYSAASNENKYPLKYDNHAKPLLQQRESTSELINRARQLYPRNKMKELEEIDTHQKRHYHNDTSKDEDARWESLRSPDGRNERELREEYGKMPVNGNAGDALRKEELKRDWQRPALGRNFKNNNACNEAGIEKLESVGRRSRVDYYKSDVQRMEFPRTSIERYGRDIDHLDDKQNRYYGRKSVDENDRVLHKPDERRILYRRRTGERYSTDEVDTHRRASVARPSASDYTDSDIRRKNLRISVESQAKDDYRTASALQGNDPRRFYNQKPLQSHRRSKSVGRLGDLEIQSLLKNVELSGRDDSYHKFSQTSCSKMFDSEEGRSSPASPIMPKLVCIKRGYRSNESPGKTQSKQTSELLEKYDCNTKSEINSEKSNENNSERKYVNNYYSSSEEKSELKTEGNFSPLVERKKSEKLLAHTFSEEEEKHLVQGIQKYGLDFKTICQEFKFHEKCTPHDLYEKWKYCYNF